MGFLNFKRKDIKELKKELAEKKSLLKERQELKKVKRELRAAKYGTVLSAGKAAGRGAKKFGKALKSEFRESQARYAAKVKAQSGGAVPGGTGSGNSSLFGATKTPDELLGFPKKKEEAVPKKKLVLKKRVVYEYK